MKFDQFGFHPSIAKGVKVAGFKEPSPIQKMAIPIINDGKDMVGQAHTGTGKTAAFGLPILDKLAKSQIQRALVITPTRELATQVSDELYHLGRFAGIRTLTVYGGVGYGRQIALIHKGVQIVVATPGRLKDLYKKGKIDVLNPEIVILDEADEMLDMGFLDDIKEIFEYIPQNRQTLLFSATMPEPIKDLASHILYKPEYLSVIGEDEQTTNNEIVQKYLVIKEEQRDNAIVALLEQKDVKKCIIFCRMKREVDRLCEHLNALGFNAGALHGDLEQYDREQIIRAYRRNEIKIMVATDVASRGLDVKGVSHVFNYHIPFDPQSYVHRIGRTGRAGRSGEAITLVSTDEFKELQRIKKEVGAQMRICTISQDSNEADLDFDKMIGSLVELRVDSKMQEFVDMLDEKSSKELLLGFVAKYASEISNGQNIGFSAEHVDRMMMQNSKDKKVTPKNNRRKRARK